MSKSPLTKKTWAGDDWWFTPGIADQTSCGRNGEFYHWDNDQHSVWSRVFLCLQYMLAVLAIAFLAWRRKLRQGNALAAQPGDTVAAGKGAGVMQPGQEDDAIADPTDPENLCRSGCSSSAAAPRERMWHLDYARITCVACIVIEHTGGDAYSFNNSLLVLQWVLPAIFSTSGICFMISRSSVWRYCGRLGILLAVGLGANFLADVVSGRDWMGDPMNTLFQMFYVVFLILFAMIGQPIRTLLRCSDTDDTSIKEFLRWRIGTLVCLIIWVVLLLVSFGYVIAATSPIKLEGPPDSWVETQGKVISNMPILIVHVCGFLCLCAEACLLRAGKGAGWVFLAVIFTQPVVVPWNGVGYAHNAQVYLFGMWVAKWPLAGSRQIKALLQNYWPLFVATILFVSQPTIKGRCDLKPAETAFFRGRWYVIEFAFLVAFVSGGVKCGDPHGVTQWLGNWSLYAYAFHVAWYRLVPIPLAAMFTFGSIPLFYLLSLRQKRKKRRLAAEKEENAPAPVGPVS